MRMKGGGGVKKSKIFVDVIYVWPHRMNMNCGVTRDDEGVAKKVIVAGGRVEDTDWAYKWWDAVSIVQIFNIQVNRWSSGKY